MKATFVLGLASASFIWAIVDPTLMSLSLGVLTTMLVVFGVSTDELALRGQPQTATIGAFRVDRHGRRPEGRWTRPPILWTRVVGPNGHVAEVPKAASLGGARDDVNAEIMWDHASYTCSLVNGRHRIVHPGGDNALVVTSAGPGLMRVEGEQIWDGVPVEPELLAETDLPERVAVFLLAYVFSDRHRVLDRKAP